MNFRTQRQFQSQIFSPVFIFFSIFFWAERTYAWAKNHKLLLQLLRSRRKLKIMIKVPSKSKTWRQMCFRNGRQCWMVRCSNVNCKWISPFSPKRRLFGSFSLVLRKIMMSVWLKSQKYTFLSDKTEVQIRKQLD